MVHAIVMRGVGGPEVLEKQEITLEPLKDGEVRIRHSAIGLNFLDVEYRRGHKKTELPTILGFEACGYIEEVKGDVGDLKVGDRVAYATAPLGAYTESRNIDHRYLIGVPSGVTDEQAAAVLLKGMTAHYLTKRTFFVQEKMFVLVHAAAGGVGMYLTQICKAMNARVIGTIGSSAKEAIAKENGCDYVVNYNQENFCKEIMKITKNQGVDVVYDCIGKETFLKSMLSLNDFGLMVLYGAASGPVPKINIEILTKKSLFLTVPSIFKYKKNRMELILSAVEVFSMLLKGVINDNINTKYNFNDIKKAHEDYEKRVCVGSNIAII